MKFSKGSSGSFSGGLAAYPQQCSTRWCAKRCETSRAYLPDFSMESGVWQCQGMARFDTIRLTNPACGPKTQYKCTFGLPGALIAPQPAGLILGCSRPPDPPLLGCCRSPDVLRPRLGRPIGANGPLKPYKNLIQNLIKTLLKTTKNT